jgi:hypothetical protein
VLALAVLASAAPAGAQDMNIALSRLSTPFDPDMPCAGEQRAGPFCRNDEGYQIVMTEFAGAMIPPVLTPAGTRGVRGIYVGFETWFTGIEASEDAWHQAVEGDGGGADTSRSTFVDSVISWGRLNVRKGLPFGFELGTNISYMANSSYWALGAEVRWSIFEGFRDGVGWIPDVAVRGAVQTLVGDGEFNVTVPSVDLILSEPFVVGNTVEITPWIVGQVAFPIVDSELVDFSPQSGAFSECNPDPRTPTPASPTSPDCRGSGDGLNDNAVFPSLRSTRWRVGAGLQIRYEWFTLLGNFMFDLVKPGDAYADPSLPARINRQWQVDVGVGLTL